MAKQFKESKDNPFHKEYGRWSNTRYILSKCRQYCPSVIIIAILGIICNSVFSYYMGFFGKFVIDVVGSGYAYDEKVQRLIIIVAIGALAAGILKLGSMFSANKAWYRYIDVRMQMIEERIARTLGLDYECLETPEALDLAERAAQSTGGNQNGVEGMMHGMENLATSLTTVIVTFVSVTILDFRLILALIVLAAIQYAFYNHIVKKDKKMVWDKLSPTWREMHYMERVTQDFDYAKDIRLFSLQDFLMGKQEQVFDKRIGKFDYHQNIWMSYNFVVAFLSIITQAAVYLVLFFAVINKEMTVGNFTLFLTLSIAFSNSLISFLQKFGDYGRASLEVDDFRSFMDLDYKSGEEDIIEEIPHKDSYTIEFKNVSYKYPEADGYAIKNFNLKIKAGEKLAVVGLNGAGKSTMIKLLLHLYDPTEGEILLDGVNIKKYSKEEYFKLFAPVFQNIEVLAFPIAEHIAMKSMENTDVRKSYECAKEAGLQEKIDSLEKGINTELLTVVDENGVDLSGGEKQKLALARALYKDAPIVVLDEPTSALDAIAEQRLYESFDHMIGSKSAVYISHRLASTRFCDNVAMFRDGEMVEYGTHDELMSMNGEYAHMFELQARYYQEEGDEENE